MDLGKALSEKNMRCASKVGQERLRELHNRTTARRCRWLLSVRGGMQQAKGGNISVWPGRLTPAAMRWFPLLRRSRTRNPRHYLWRFLDASAQNRPCHGI